VSVRTLQSGIINSKGVAKILPTETAIIRERLLTVSLAKKGAEQPRELFRGHVAAGNVLSNGSAPYVACRMLLLLNEIVCRDFASISRILMFTFVPL
jgi:hypothetical protein